MTSSRTILENLKNLNQFLGKFHQSKQSAYFEKLIAEVFSHVLYLPYFTSDNEDINTPHRLTWQGQNDPISGAPRGKPDAIAYCSDFCLIIEATLKTGANQCSQEFAQSIRHRENFCSQTAIQQKDAIVLLICTELHIDTYRSIRSSPRQEYKLIPIQVLELVKILETSILAFTMRHLELRLLLNGISNLVQESPSLDDFQRNVDGLLANWQKEVLNGEKCAFLGVKSYEAICQIGRTNVNAAEILSLLLNNSIVKRYFDIIHDKPTIPYIEESLIKQSLGVAIGKTTKDELIFERVHSADFKARGLRLIKAVEEVNG